MVENSINGVKSFFFHLSESPFLMVFAVAIGVFILIFLARVILTYLLERAYRRYVELKSAGKRILSTKKYIKEEEELLREKFDIPRAHSEVKAELKAKIQASNKARGAGSYEVIESPEQDWDNHALNESQIVDIVKPVGFWTSMILGQKLTYLMQSAKMVNNRGEKGFWVSMIEAKERAAGKQHSRGR